MADFMGKLRKFTQKQVEKMDDAAKRFSGLPGYDQDTLDAYKELKAKSKTKEGLTSTEERDLDRLARKMIREAGAETTEGMAKEGKARKLTEKEKKEMQESLEFKRGGMVPMQMKQARQEVKAARQEMKQAGMPKPERKAAIAAMKQEKGLPASKPAMGKAAIKPRKVAKQAAMGQEVPMMMGGGYAVKKMAKGGMANCGASMKPNGGSRNK